MRVFLAETAGFCMGVKRAVNLALEVAGNGKGDIYTIGPLIHNPQTVEMLERKGIKVVEDISNIKSGTIIIRAHGMTPQKRREIIDSGLDYFDATCPLVVRIQKTISRHVKMGFEVVIVGDKGHAEVDGLLGYADGRGTVVEKEDDIEHVPDGKICVVAQSTQNRSFFEYIVELLKKKRDSVKVFDTICDATTERQEEVRMLAEKVDAMVIVGGRNSANTHRLAELSRSLGVKTFHVESADELNEEDIASCEDIGVTAGASTPNWVIEKVIDRINIIGDVRESRVLKFLTKLGGAIVKSDLFVGMGAGLLCLSMILLQDSRKFIFSSTLLSVLISACYVFGVHILNHFTDREYAQYKESYKLSFLDHYRIPLIILGVISMLAAIAFSSFLGMIPLIILLFASISGLIYSFRIVPAPIARIIGISRIRDIPASKNLLMALAWCVITAFVPVFEMHRAFDAEKWRQLFVVLVYTFTLVFTRSTLLDIRDIQGDLMLGNETLPILLGKQRTGKIILIVLVACTVILLAATAAGWVSTLGYYLLVPIAYNFVYIGLHQKKRFLQGFSTEIAVNTSFFIAGAVSLIYYIVNDWQYVFEVIK